MLVTVDTSDSPVKLMTFFSYPVCLKLFTSNSKYLMTSRGYDCRLGFSNG
jgi:hypothetical protein